MEEGPDAPGGVHREKVPKPTRLFRQNPKPSLLEGDDELSAN